MTDGPAADLLALAARTKGFMPQDEGLALYRAALQALPEAPVLEIGSYCGLSSLYLGAAAVERDGTVFTLDHHRGSEETQPGWEYHDPEVVDPVSGRMDTLPYLRRTLERAGLEEHVICVVGRSTAVSRWWRTPLSMVFIDGGHAREHAENDYAGWAPWVGSGGLLAIHDVFPDPADGGRPPYEIYLRALAGGSFEEVSVTGSLRVLRRVRGEAGDPVG